uniref:Unconventional myosin-XVIIIa-like n=1 Tax=Saccoglossus kowalevskii TaxID=10224 RepID=A0ABM0MD28_SACKO|nr:PREDICTED: unconventional myosin-XVIIIa-like [Saccoglossus kowalevskii]
MFSFSRKKDKDHGVVKKEKKDKSSKRDKRPRSLDQPALTVEELGRLEEVGLKRGLVFPTRKKKAEITSKSTSDTSSVSSLPLTSDSSTLGAYSSSEQSLNSTPSENTSKASTPSPEIRNGVKSSSIARVKPRPAPKPRGILKGKSSYPAPPYVTIADKDKLDDTTVLVENTLFNQDVPGRTGETNIPHPIPETVPIAEIFNEKSFDVDLQLPAVAPPKPPRSREVILQRQPAGDYGFSLRRSLLVERYAAGNKEVKRYVHFAEPGANKENVTGLLPGDRLVEVNGTNVENVQRDQIVDMIRKSGQSVTLKVQPIPELSELSIRSGLDGRDFHLDNEQVHAGSLQRSGSKRYIKNLAKTEDQLATEHDWLKAEKVWLVHKGGFAGAKLLNNGEEDEGKVQVKLEHGGEVLAVDEEDVEKANPPQFDRAEDIATLRNLNESGVAHIASKIR